MAPRNNQKTNDPNIQHDEDEQPIIMMPETLQDVDVIQLGLLNNHTHFLQGEINYDTVGRAVQWIIYENTQPPDKGQTNKVLTLYINSGGGDLYNAFALVDVMHASRYPIHTVGMGNIMSAAALIFACGEKKHRLLAKHTGILMHQFYSDLQGKEHELQAAMKELEFCRERVQSLLVHRCRISEKVVTQKLLQPSDAWLTAEEAVKLRLADGIFTKFNRS